MLFDAPTLDEIQVYMRSNPHITTDEFQEFLTYRSTIASREILYKNFRDDKGRFQMEAMSPSDKRVLNTLSNNIARYEHKIKDTPIYDDLVKKFESSGLPDFLTKDEQIVEKAKELMKGWYQNSKGDLFHYDGIVWDDVPGESIKDLEFLGD